MAKYIYEYPHWTKFTWDDKKINVLFGEVRQMQGKIIQQMSSLGFSAKEEVTLSALTLDVIKSSEIEGEILNYEQVRSSIARHLGINTAGLVHSNRNIEGVVAMLLDATQNYQSNITKERLFGWHAALFPTGYSGLYKIEVGQYRTGATQIVSGALGKEKVHFEAVQAKLVASEMDSLLNWITNDTTLDPVLKAAITHFWFIIIHPFDDGNGRIARALTDMLLAKSENTKDRFYSMSSQILLERKQYYEILQKVQFSNGDITEWLQWFLLCLKKTLLLTEETTQKVIKKVEFWQIHEQTSINNRQRIMLNKLLDGFEGKLKTSKWAKITKTSTDTALRDIKDLISKGILIQTDENGRNCSYELK